MLPPRAVGLGQPAVDAADDRSRAAVQEGGRPAVVSYLEPRLGVVLGSVACDPRLESNAVEHPLGRRLRPPIPRLRLPGLVLGLVPGGLRRALRLGCRGRRPHERRALRPRRPGGARGAGCRPPVLRRRQRRRAVVGDQVRGPWPGSPPRPSSRTGAAPGCRCGSATPSTTRAGRRSGVAGHGAITTPYSDPSAHEPTGPWIGMTGTDPPELRDHLRRTQTGTSPATATQLDCEPPPRRHRRRRRHQPHPAGRRRLQRRARPPLPSPSPLASSAR